MPIYTFRWSLDSVHVCALVLFSCEFHVLFTGFASTLFSKNNFKTKSHNIIHIFKNYFIKIFLIFNNKQYLIFSNKQYV